MASGSTVDPSASCIVQPVTTNERLHQLVDLLDDEQQRYALELLEGLTGVVPTQRRGQHSRPTFAGMGHGPADLAERSEELLHEFGEQPAQ